MKLGIGSYTYMWSIGFPGAAPEHPMDARALLGKACELGVRVVQFGPNLPLDAMADAELDSLAAAAGELNIEIEAGTHGIEPDHLRRYLGIARRCGATLVRSLPELSGGRIPTAEECVTRLCAVAAEFEAAGVRLALENARLPSAMLSGILDRVGSPFIGITLDTVNSLAIPEGTEQVARTLARHTLCLHVKDFVVERVWHMMGFTVEGRPAGKGQLNVPWLLEVLKDAGRSPNAILELWIPQQTTLEATIAMERAWAGESIAYLRNHIPE